MLNPRDSRLADDTGDPDLDDDDLLERELEELADDELARDAFREAEARRAGVDGTDDLPAAPISAPPARAGHTATSRRYHAPHHRGALRKFDEQLDRIGVLILVPLGVAMLWGFASGRLLLALTMLALMVVAGIAWGGYSLKLKRRHSGDDLGVDDPDQEAELRRRIEAYRQSAEERLATGEPLGAVYDYRELLRLDPGDVETRLALVAIWEDQLDLSHHALDELKVLMLTQSRTGRGDSILVGQAEQRLRRLSSAVARRGDRLVEPIELADDEPDPMWDKPRQW